MSLPAQTITVTEAKAKPDPANTVQNSDLTTGFQDLQQSHKSQRVLLAISQQRRF